VELELGNEAVIVSWSFSPPPVRAYRTLLDIHLRSKWPSRTGLGPTGRDSGSPALGYSLSGNSPRAAASGSREFWVVERTLMYSLYYLLYCMKA